MKLPKILENVIGDFARLPGIGGKSAQRHALHLTKWSHDEVKEFAQNILAMTELKRCQRCGVFSAADICIICTNPRRQESRILCVVETISDCIAVESSEQYKGLYHVLGGVLNPLLGIGPDELNFAKLLNRIESENIESVILAVNSSVEGDATCSYLRDMLEDRVKIERIGFGIPMGGSLEYLDAMTISKALENRKQI